MSMESYGMVRSWMRFRRLLILVGRLRQLFLSFFPPVIDAK